MSSRTTVLLLAAAGATIFAASTLYWLNTSPWLLWHLLPEAPLKITWTSRAFGALAGPLATHVIPPEFDGLPYRKLAVAKRGERTVVVVAPGLHYAAWRTAARVGGWRVEMQGVLLRLSKASAAQLPTRQQALQNLVRSLTTAGWPLRPAAVFESTPQAVPLLSETVRLVVTAHHGEVRVLALSQPNARGAALAIEQPDTDEAVLQLPGTALAVLPVPLREAWNALLADHLHFSLTRPDFITALSRYPEMVLHLTHDQVVLGVRDEAGSFTAVATTWVQEEERRTRLETHPFRLPDGTVGYERVPGPAQPVFATAVDGSCDAPLAGRTTLWLCRNGMFTALTSTSQAGVRSLAAITPHWRLAVGNEVWQHAGQCQNDHDGATSIWCFVQSAAFSMRPDRAAGVLKLRPQIEQL